MDFKAEMQGQKDWLKYHKLVDGEVINRVISDASLYSPKNSRRRHNPKKRKKEKG